MREYYNIQYRQIVVMPMKGFAAFSWHSKANCLAKLGTSELRLGLGWIGGLLGIDLYRCGLFSVSQNHASS